MLQAAISAGTTYLIKKFLTPSSIIIRPTEDDETNINHQQENTK